MPQRILCEDCNEILYQGSELVPPEEIIRKHDGRCPKCGKKLCFTAEKVEVKALKL
jgi:DNA-directed RNA polymerase subunit RPC12/RpoP